MATSAMRSESRAEARERMVALSEAEKQGAAAATEGILTPMFRTPQDEERAAQIDANDQARLELQEEISGNGPGEGFDVTEQLGGAGESGEGGEPRQARRGRKPRR